MGTPFTSRTFAGVEGGAFVLILVFGALVGACAFLWTLETTEPSAFIRSVQGSGGQRDPDPSFEAKAHQMYALGGNHALVQAAEVRRTTWPTDLNGWLLPAFAFERLGDEPGLQAMEYRANAKQLWADLLIETQRTSFPVRTPLYYEGWALMGLGRPMLARERFGRFVENIGRNGFAINSYNKSCYLSLAGDLDAAQQAWAEAARRQRLTLLWSEHDPDLELLHGTLEFEVWLAWQQVRREQSLLPQIRQEPEQNATGSLQF